MNKISGSPVSEISSLGDVHLERLEDDFDITIPKNHHVGILRGVSNIKPEIHIEEGDVSSIDACNTSVHGIFVNDLMDEHECTNDEQIIFYDKRDTKNSNNLIEPNHRQYEKRDTHTTHHERTTSQSTNSCHHRDTYNSSNGVVIDLDSLLSDCERNVIS
jgi:hypothetical protein